MKRHSMIQQFTCMVILLLLSGSVLAGIDPPVVKVLSGRLGQLKVDSSVLVEDAKWFSPAYEGKLEKPYPFKNVIMLQINETAPVILQSAFRATVRVRINYVTNDNVSRTLDTALTVTYDSASTYNQKSVFVLNNAARVEVKVLQLTKNVSWDAFQALEIINQLQSFPKYVFSCTGNAISSIEDSVLAPDTQYDELPVYWAPSIGADEYDLEWSYVDSSALASGKYGSPLNADLIFENNASRVTITGTSYRIPIVYDNKGHLFFRVRAVQWQPGGGRNETNWSSQFSAGLGRFDYNGHERSLNWQATTNFAEEGKRKTIVQYYDGSLRMRQVVTRDNTSNIAMVAETFYDYQGRAVVQVLPAPSINNLIQYSRNFNKGFNSNIYDKYNYDTLSSPSAYCSMTAAPMDSASGAAKYFSSLNPQKNTGIHRYIPNANGYPFVETEFTQDNSARISRQSSAGETHRLGSGHETKYFYGTPDQRELDALFGTEVGHYSHYFKMMVRNPNGQYHVTYTDMHNRTIATALAGVPPPDIKLDTLASYVSATRTENLSNPAATIIKDMVMENKRSLLVAKAGMHTFNYKLDPLSLQKEGCNAANVCYDCLYDLQITITDDCNNQKLGGAPFDTLIRNFSLAAIDTLCSNGPGGFSFSFQKFLEEGSYLVTKKLSVNRTGMDYYRDSVFMRKNTCRTVDDFFSEQRQLLAGVLQCKPTCQTCKDSVGTWPQFWARFRQRSGIADVDSAAYKNMALEAYDVAVQDCRAMCDSLSEQDDIRGAMLMDLTPSAGQYADLAREEDHLSVFFSSMDGVLPDTTAKYRQVTNYLDANGNPDLVFDEMAGAMVPPQQLSPEMFAQKFKLSWAEALLPHHPEYCKLVRYEMLNPSHAWDRRFRSVDTYAEALAKGYLNPIGDPGFPARFNGTAGQIDRDPLPALDPAIFSGKLRDSILQYRNISSLGNVSLWGVATTIIMCQKATDNTSCYNTYSTTANAFNPAIMCAGDLDMAWRAYKQMYLEIKRNIINKYWIPLGVCTTAMTATALVNAGHQPNFSDAVELQKATGTNFPNTMDEANAYKQQNEAQLNSFYGSQCEAFAAQWWQQLRPCGYNNADSAWIVRHLIAVCKEGADKDHPFGASTVRPGSTFRFKSFQEVLSYYADSVSVPFNTPACNVYRITDPPPYDRPKVYSNADIWEKPDACQCNVITSVHQKYQSNNLGYGSFAAYVNGRYNLNMQAADLQTLLDLCNGTNTCKYLPRPISLPAPLQCGSELACASCKDIAQTYAQFLTDFPGVYILMEDSVSEMANYIATFTNYFNTKLGFKKEYSEYLTFMQQCGIRHIQPSYTAPSTGGSVVERPGSTGNPGTGVTCDTLQQIVSSFNTLFPNLTQFNTVTVRGRKILRPWLEYLLSCTGILKPYPQQQKPFPPEWKGSGLRDSGFSNRWYRNNMTFVKFNFWELPHYVEIDSVNLRISPIQTDTLMFWSTMFHNWDTTLRCSQLGATYYGNNTSVRNPQYRYLTAQGNQMNVYHLRNKYIDLITFPQLYLGDVLHSIMNPTFQAENTATVVGTRHPLALADPETSPNIDVWYRKDTVYQCRDLIAAYFNYRLKSALTYDAIAALYQQKCGVALPISCAAENQTLSLCGRNEPVFPSVQLEDIDNCTDSTFFIVSKGTELYNTYVDSLENNFDSLYRARCLQAYQYERFTVTRGVSEFHYTLYYYDQAGNLVKTIPPAGVQPKYDSLWLDSVQTARLTNQVKVPAHTLAIQSRYNTLNQPVAKFSPDGGLTEMWYDRLGRMAISRNARQRAASATENNRLYSYTQYDGLGRMVETGEIRNAGTLAMHDSISRKPAALVSWLNASAANKSQITHHIFDLPYTAFGTGTAPIIQKNLRNRLSYISYTAGNNAARYNHASFFSYDIMGNIDTLVQDYGSSDFAEVQNVMNTNNNRFKKMSYRFDVVSGKINSLAYQYGQADQQYYRYTYDAENRLVMAETSADSVVWEKEARYEYYQHGSLARQIIGDQQVQGIDYAYTLNGKLKGINSTGLNANYDMGEDGRVGTLNQFVARDAMGLTLNYYANDYKSINTSVTPFPAYSAFLNNNYRPLYDGNISSMSVHIASFSAPIFYNYKYDQLSRLTAMDAYNGYNASNNNWNNLTLIQDYRERISYDANGNILKYLRNGSGSNLTMDSLTYHYNRDAQGRLVNNRLTFIRDRVNNSTAHSGTYTTDIDDQAASNYSYDSTGNLTGDVQEGITSITWDVNGKIAAIQRNATSANPVSNIQYTYDGFGNRVSKRVQLNNGNVTVTNYARDAAGNVIAVYNSTGSGTSYGSYTLSVQEHHIYGLNRLGIVNSTINLKTVSVRANPDTFVRGRKYYELSNHVGNVLVVVTDKKFAVVSGSTVEHYKAEIVSATDYYPFGMPSRVASGNKEYRYGFNGHEKSNEIKGTGNSYTAPFWEYDPRAARRWNTDPKPNPAVSLYSAFDNNPILNQDILGDSIDPGRTTGVNIIIVANKSLRDKDIEDNGKLASAYNWDYKKAKKMERKSKGSLIVIEAKNAADAVAQIKAKLGSDKYIKNLTIDYHADDFGDQEITTLSSMMSIKELAGGYAGIGSTVYLGQCWAGGNPDRSQADHTSLVSDLLDGATVYGNKAAASSFSFYLFNTFIGPVWQEYGKADDNLKYFGQHTATFYHPVTSSIVSTVVKDMIKISNSGEILRKSKVPLETAYLVGTLFSRIGIFIH